MRLHDDQYYAALSARDARFDGLFFVGVTTTGIYCRPICRVRLPGRDRCRFFGHPAAAEAAGFRPCLRCRPELAPGDPTTGSARRVCDRAVARIEAGALSEASVDELAAEFEMTARQLRRVVKQAYGVTPIELAQTRRLLLAKQLLADTSLPIADIAFASGFTSVRRFNELFRSRYQLSPSGMRRPTNRTAPDSLRLTLGYRQPLAWSALLTFLRDRGADCVEQIHGQVYRRTVAIGGARGWITAQLAGHDGRLVVDVSDGLVPKLDQLRMRLRRLFDLDANPRVIDAHLALDPTFAEGVNVLPGLRVPGTLDGFDLAARTVIGQQVSIAAATTLYTRFVHAFGRSLDTPYAGLTHLTPQAEHVAGCDPGRLAAIGLPRQRARTLHALACAVAERRLILDPEADTKTMLDRLAALPGIGPWSVQYIAMRALGQPDAYPATDLVLRRFARDARSSGSAAAARPWRAYAAMQLWHHAAHGG
ncbi:AlkA N-terminal domain-containing protein [Salinisphaera sp. T31B1]|uniref:AlkA N-terminal domain-containing protein n=1 Tax=Salinisphaera sp. T31B1 TaxID=727963 RepID=UPI0033412CD0